MPVYLVVIFLTFVLGYIAKRNTVVTNTPMVESNKLYLSAKLAMVCIGIVLICVSGFRYNVGADFAQYFLNYRGYVNAEINILKNNEIVILLIAKLASLFNDFPQTYIFISAVATIVPFLIVIKKKSIDVLMSIILFIFMGMFLGSFNAMRQYLAAAAVFVSLMYIIEAKPVKSTLWCIIGFFCHTTAIIMIPIYWFVRIKDRKKFFIILIIISIVLFFSYDRIFAFIDAYKGLDGRSASDTLYAQHGVNVFRVLVAWAPAILCLFPTSIMHTEDPTDNILINTVFLAAAIQTISMNSAYLSRVCIYTNCAELLAIPMILKYQTANNYKVLKALIYFLYFFYWLNEATGSYLINYQWCF